MARFFQYQAKTEPTTLLVNPGTAVAAIVSMVAVGVTFTPRFIYQAKTDPVAVTAETVTADKWLYPWAEPIRVRRFAAAQQDIVADAPSQIVASFGWYRNLETPVRLKKPLSNQQQALAYSYFTPVTVQLVEVTEPRILLEKSFSYNAYAAPPFVPSGETITPDKWYIQWTDPARQKKIYLQQAATGPVLSDSQLTGTIEARWHQPWSEPVRLRRFLTAQQDIAADVASQTVSFSWYRNLETPPFRVKYPPSKQDIVADVPFTGETIFADKWIYRWSDPVRFRRLLAAEQQTLAYAYFTPSIALIEVSEPRLLLEKSFAYNAYVAPPFVPTGETITPDKWYVEWTDPVRFKRFLTAQQVSLAYIGAAPFPETVTESRWHQPWSEPVRVRRFAPSEQDISADGFAPIVTLGWYRELEQPPKRKQFTPAQQDFEADSYFTPPAAAAQIATPSITSQVTYRYRLIYQSLAQPIVFTAAEVITEDKWHYPWSEPVRLKRGLVSYLQQPLVQAARPPIVSFGYYGWLSEPTRPKKGLAAHLQQAFTQAPLFPNLVKFIQWFEPFTDPVRPKIGLLARLQQFFTTDTKTPVSGVTVILDATETNTDQALFGISVFNRADRAVVSIREIPATNSGAASIEELARRNDAAASIKEM